MEAGGHRKECGEVKGEGSPTQVTSAQETGKKLSGSATKEIIRGHQSCWHALLCMQLAV